LKLSVAEA
jgi:dynein heavy chain